MLRHGYRTCAPLPTVSVRASRRWFTSQRLGSRQRSQLRLPPRAGFPGRPWRPTDLLVADHDRRPRLGSERIGGVKHRGSLAVPSRQGNARPARASEKPIAPRNPTMTAPGVIVANPVRLRESALSGDAQNQCIPLYSLLVLSRCLFGCRRVLDHSLHVTVPEEISYLESIRYGLYRRHCFGDLSILLAAPSRPWLSCQRRRDSLVPLKQVLGSFSIRAESLGPIQPIDRAVELAMGLAQHRRH